MADRAEFTNEYRRLNALSEKDLQVEAQAKFKARGSLADTLQLVQDYAEVDRRQALIIYLMADELDLEDDDALSRS